MRDGHCWFCAAPVWDDDEDACPHCGIDLDGDYRQEFWGNPYDDEGGRGFAEHTRGEEAAASWPAEWTAQARAADERRSTTRGAP